MINHQVECVNAHGHKWNRVSRLLVSIPTLVPRTTSAFAFCAASPFLIETDKFADQDGGFPEPMVVHKIHLQSSTDAQDMSSTNALPSDFVPFWTEPSNSPETNSEDFTPSWLENQEGEEQAKSQRKKNKLSKIVPSFLRKRSMMGKKT